MNGKRMLEIFESMNGYDKINMHMDAKREEYGGFFTDIVRGVFLMDEDYVNGTVEDLIDESMEENDTLLLTALVCFLNHGCWDLYERGMYQASRLLDKMYKKVHRFALENLKDEELTAYLRVID